MNELIVSALYEGSATLLPYINVVLRLAFSVIVTFYWIEYFRPLRFKLFRRKPFSCQYCLPLYIFAFSFPLSNILLFTISAAFLSGITSAHIIQWSRQRYHSQNQDTPS